MIGDLANHLWQSTVFAAAAGSLVLLVRRNHARVRYWIWFAASLKFFVPFAALVALGSQLNWAPAAERQVAPDVAATVIQISEPFAEHTVVAAAPASSAPDVQPWRIVLIAAWGIGLAAIVSIRVQLWRRVRRVLRTSVPVQMAGVEVPASVPVRSVSGVLEPSIVGIFRPILLLPAGIEDYISSRQLQAVIAHELCHARRRDNLTAAIHMVVEAMFWFHPMVWWIGARLVDERERACDEEVLRQFGEPQTYAEGILAICRRYVEAPLQCVSGVSGADLNKRIDLIMKNRMATSLGLARRAVLATAGFSAVLGPLVLGLLGAASLHAQSTLLGSAGQRRPAFEVASVRPVDRTSMTRDHEGFQLTATTFVDRTDLLQFIVRAYLGPDGAGLCVMKTAFGEDCPLIVGTLPAWVKADKWEIQARLPADTFAGQTPRTWAAESNPVGVTSSPRRNVDAPQVSLMLQVLLEDRFGLEVRRETRELPVWALRLGNNELRLKPAGPPEVRTDRNGNGIKIQGLGSLLMLAAADGSRRGRMTFQASSMKDAADDLSEYFERPVVDRTGLEGEYDFTLEYEADPTAQTLYQQFPFRNAGLTAARLSAALEGLGLRLESTTVPFEVLVIDHVEMPSPN